MQTQSIISIFWKLILIFISCTINTMQQQQQQELQQRQHEWANAAIMSGVWKIDTIRVCSVARIQLTQMNE